MKRSARSPGIVASSFAVMGLMGSPLFSGVADAQDLGNCPAGMHTVFDNGRPSCAFDSNHGSGNQAPYRSADELGYFFGAIAVASDGQPSWTYGNASQRVADAGALKFCNKHRKSKKLKEPCRIALQWNGGYASIATGNAPFNYFGLGRSVATAEAAAIEACRKERNDCQLWTTISSRRSEEVRAYDLDFGSGNGDGVN